MNTGNLYKKIASIIFMSGNIVLWLAGIVDIYSGWNNVVGSTLMVLANACYFFGNNTYKWNFSGHMLSILGMLFLNIFELIVGSFYAVFGFALYTSSRLLGASLLVPFGNKCQKITTLTNFFRVKLFFSKFMMIFLGIASRMAMLWAAIQNNNFILASVLFIWNIADIFLGIGPSHTKMK